MYKIINEQQILRINDDAIIPVCKDNMDYQEYLEWLNEGNTAEKMTIPPTNLVTRFNKLKIVEAFEKLGKINVLHALLNDPVFNLYWTSANEIDINHSKTVAAMAQLNADNSNNLTGEKIIETILAS